MKALTVRPLWAHLIATGQKRVENRTWRTSHRGPLAIHAAARSGDELALIPELRAAGYTIPDPEELVCGAVVAVVDLVGVVPFQPGEPRLPGCEREEDLAGDRLATGPVCWLLAEPRRIERPIAARGQQGLWEIEIPGNSFAGQVAPGQALPSRGGKTWK